MNPDNVLVQIPDGPTITEIRPTRPEALKQAEELVNRLSPVNNQRGYADGAAAALPQRVTAILEIANWLCAGRSE